MSSQGSGDSLFPRCFLRRGGFKRSILLPFAFLIAAGFLAGWMVYLHGSRMALQGAMDSLVMETAGHVQDRLAGYLSGAASLAQLNAFSFGGSQTSPSYLAYVQGILRYELLQRQNFDIISIGFADGEYVEAQRRGSRIWLGEAGRETGGDFVSRLIDEEGRPGTVVLRRGGYDPRTRPWYEAASAAVGPVFTKPYPIVSTGELAMAAVAPYRVGGRLRAVATTDIRLGELSAFLASIEAVQGGVAAIADQDGRLIASSEGASTAPSPSAGAIGGGADGLSARLVGLARSRSEGRVFGLREGSRSYRAAVFDRAVGSGLSWRIAVALPETRFMAPLRRTDELAPLILLVMLAGALVLAFVAADRVAAPLRELGLAISSLDPVTSASEVGPAAEPRPPFEAAERLSKRFDEIGRLAESFVAMSRRLDENFARLNASIREKEVLLQEVHHRVKNNLQIVSSMLRLEDGLSSDPAFGLTLSRIQDRIQAMAFVHEDLYRSKDFSSVRMDEYLASICEALAGSRSIPGRIEVVPPSRGIELSLERALPCGLIVNELVSNALMHAFADRNCGRVEVSLVREGDQFLLAVEDDGVGLPEGLRKLERGGMGFQLVLALAQQLQGRVEFRDAPAGTRIELRFPG